MKIHEIWFVVVFYLAGSVTAGAIGFYDAAEIVSTVIDVIMFTVVLTVCAKVNRSIR